jgi:hypothetical protein
MSFDKRDYVFPKFDDDDDDEEYHAVEIEEEVSKTSGTTVLSYSAAINIFSLLQQKARDDCVEIFNDGTIADFLVLLRFFGGANIETH